MTPVGQLGLSALAIDGAGIVQKALLETSKAGARTGQMSVPDLLGGEQRLNLFSLALPDKTPARKMVRRCPFSAPLSAGKRDGSPGVGKARFQQRQCGLPDGT
ncbi:hypothetical protein XAB3213_320004 [Xanthomonas citri pv. bilvae]|nr:hypothetical protein XAB3213_320004 [Xanthomonas citri pv. bilvae]